MKDGMEKLARGLGVVSRLSLWIAGLGLVAMTAIVSTQVFFRYALNSSIVWSEPAAVILMGWFIFLGAAVGIREGYHLSFDVLLHVLPDRMKAVLHTTSDLVVCAFGFGMAWYGGQLMLSAAGSVLPTLGISGAVDFLPLVFGGGLVMLFSLERVLRRAAGLPTARFGETGNGA